MKTNADVLKAVADKQGIPYRTGHDVRQTLSKAEKFGTSVAMAGMLLRHGRLTDEARAYVEGYLAGK
jgi:membrane peptidoglycan carboxypeptidase